MPTVCKDGSQVQFEFQQSGSRQVIADFEGGQITSDAGAVLLRQVEIHTELIADLAACFTDRRDPRYTDHSLQELIRQRVLGIACGYEDLNDHDQLRREPMWGLLAGKTNPGEEAPAGGDDSCSDRYHKIDLDQQAFTDLFTRWYIRAHSQDPPAQIILDLDATDDPLLSL